MFDINFSELIVIGTIALVVIGPKKLPRVARTIGYLLGRMQRYLNGVKLDIAREIELDKLEKLKTKINDVADDIEISIGNTTQNLNKKMQEELTDLDHTRIQPIEKFLEKTVNEESTEKKY